MHTGRDLAFDPAREEAELREYLGAGFELDRLQRYQDQLEREFAACGDEERFYRSSHGIPYVPTTFCTVARTSWSTTRLRPAYWRRHGVARELPR